MTEGLDECLANLAKLQTQVPRKAREAVTEAAEMFAENLEANTPLDDSAKVDVYLKDNVVVTGFKGASTHGRIEKDIGYGKEGKRAKYPDTGTIFQRPQNFIERTISQSTEPALEIYAQKIREGLQL